ncbi:MAG: cupin domain-containing protein [Desulforhopalus sp.]|nr:cupin domain-containing protein [Desulforhopalus sp.]
MVQSFTIVLLVFWLFSFPSAALSLCPEPILPESLRWGGPPNLPALQGAWVLGAEGVPGNYILRVKLAAGGKIPPHTHPDERNTTVLSGTISVGFGEQFDASQVVSVPAGAVYVAPADVPHYIWAKEGPVVYQEAGTGPTKTSFIKP